MLPQLPQPTINPESKELMDALLARQDVIGDAFKAFRRGYPDASEFMIEKAVKNVVCDGIEACVDWLGAIEEFLRARETLGSVRLNHLMYHLYNWEMIEAIMPLGKHGLHEHLGDVEQLLEYGNTDAALDRIKMLRERISGDEANPLTG